MKSFQPYAFGKYLLVEKISSGGMGEIFRAKTFGINGFEKQLAIKRMLPQLSENEDFANMLTDEAKLSVQLTHTNIVQIYDLGKIEDEYFISMEYVNGVDLRHILLAHEKSGQKIPEEITLYIMSEVCRGLEYAHSKKNKEGQHLGIIHRDISPPNILVSFEGEVKVADFGIAKVEQNTHHTRTGILKGKIPYMSPEQARGEKLDHRTDIFACGMVLLEMLTGKRLFTEEDPIQLLLKIRDTPISAEMFPDSIAGELKKILLQALASDRQKRYAHAGKLQIDLTHYLHTNYPDFTPHQLAEWMQKLFSKTLEEKAQREKTENKIDQKTYEALLKSGQQEYLVHRENSALISPKISHFSKHRMDYFLLFLVLLLIGGLLFYKLYRSKVPLQETEEVTSDSSAAPLWGSLQISTTPPGAKIFINGRDSTRSTPYVFHDLKIGENYILTLTLPEYHDIVRPVQLKDSKLMLVSETFSPLAVVPTPKTESAVSPKRLTRSLPKAKVSENVKKPPEKAAPEKTEEIKKNEDGSVTRGFKKAGSAIKNFFTGGKSKENQDTTSGDKNGSTTKPK